MGSIGFVLGLIPCTIYGAYVAAGRGAGWAWLLVNTAYLLIWVPVIHKRLLGRIHWLWLSHDILPVGITSLACAFAFKFMLAAPGSRATSAAQLVAITAVSGIAAIFAAPRVRSALSARMLALRNSY
jgi:hypothetical protein